MTSYAKKMDAVLKRSQSGLDPDAFTLAAETVEKEVKEEYENVTIFGSEETRGECWEGIKENLQRLHDQYFKDNEVRLQQALAGFANLAILGATLFILDRVSDWTCDWWSQTCHEVSKLMLLAYLGIFAYIGFYVYKLVSDQGKMAAGLAGAELWKEMLRLLSVYGELAKQMNLHQIPAIAQKVMAGTPLRVAMEDLAKEEKKPDNKKKD